MIILTLSFQRVLPLHPATATTQAPFLTLPLHRTPLSTIPPRQFTPSSSHAPSTFHATCPPYSIEARPLPTLPPHHRTTPSPPPHLTPYSHTAASTTRPPFQPCHFDNSRPSSPCHLNILRPFRALQQQAASGALSARRASPGPPPLSPQAHFPRGELIRENT